MKHSFMLTIPETKRKISIDTENILRFCPRHDEFEQFKKRPDIVSVITDAIFNISVDQFHNLGYSSSLLTDLVNIEEYITSNNIRLSYQGDLADINHHKFCIALAIYNLQSASIRASYSKDFKEKLIELEYLKLSVGDYYDSRTHIFNFETRFTRRALKSDSLLSLVSDSSILDNLKSKLSKENKTHLCKFQKKTFQPGTYAYWSPTSARVAVASVGINKMKSWFNTVEDFKTIPPEVRFELLKLDPEHFYLMYPDKKKIPWKKLSKYVENLHLRIPESTFYLLSR